jgi:hypothetical protein
MLKKNEIYTCSICSTEINTESKMIVDRDEDECLRGTLCESCHAIVLRDDPFVLLQATQYILLGGYPEDFEEDDGEIPKPKRAETRRGLTEEDRNLIEKRYGVREFTTLRDDEFTIPKLKGRKKAVPKKKSAPKKSKSIKKPAGKASALHRGANQPRLGANAEA